MDTYDEERKRQWEDLDVTRDELEAIGECLKKEEFRYLLREFASEVNDPKNREIYQNEIVQLERERGVDVTFVNPEAGYVIKTSVNGDKKCFLNISKSDVVARPSSQPTFEDGHRGLQWSIPYSLVPPRDDLDKKNAYCKVFDVVFHPDTLYLATKNARFREMVNNTAMDAVENNFKVKLDRKNIKFPKISFKGLTHPTVIRKPSENPVSNEGIKLEHEIYQKIMSGYDESRKRHQNTTKEIPKRTMPLTKYYNKTEIVENSNSVYVTPKFTIKHSSNMEMNDFVDSRDSKIFAAIPKKLIVTVYLPLLKSAKDATLDVQERILSVKSEKPAKYFLELPLPYCVNAECGNAKFDINLKRLIITLPVIRPAISCDGREDSGVDSDHENIQSAILDNSHLKDEYNSDSTVGTFKSDDCNSYSLNENSALIVKCDNTKIRTNVFEEKNFLFVNPNVRYSLPPCICNIYDNQLTITVNVKNVDPNSISHRILDNDLGIHILLTSIGAGFFPMYYSLCLKMDGNPILPQTLTIEPWDNNIVFSIMFKSIENLSRYYIGLNEEIMEPKEFPTAVTFENKLKELTIMPNETSNVNNVSVKTENGNVVININAGRLDSDDDDDENLSISVSPKATNSGRNLANCRSVSESSGDELASSNSSSTRCKGILKSRRSQFSRSISESSADENAITVSSVDLHYDMAHDFNSESDCSSLKKTVRFNDVVSRQLFRSNSSILGQRKKNQRKMKNKKRAHERRFSESENSETEEREKYKINQKHETNKKIGDLVKPILNREKQMEREATENIDIKNLKVNDKLNKLKRKTDTKENNPNAVEFKNSFQNADHSEFKNDLIFDLDI